MESVTEHMSQQCARQWHDCDMSVRVSRYIGQSPGTPSMGTRGEACGLERK